MKTMNGTAGQRRKTMRGTVGQRRKTMHGQDCRHPLGAGLQEERSEMERRLEMKVSGTGIARRKGEGCSC
jgi:hypothetical protein